MLVPDLRMTQRVQNYEKTPPTVEIDNFGIRDIAPLNVLFSKIVIIIC